MTTITVEKVSKQYQLKNNEITQAVNNVSFKVSEGGSIAIVGPSGCGKTTLLRMIANLEIPDSGQILYDDEPIHSVPNEDRGIGMVFQNYALMPQWDAERNIGFFLRLRKRQREVPERVQQISKITGVGIEMLMGQLPRQLSGGEKQRVAIARAFARDLKILLFDEPFANLDTKLRQQARIEARRLLAAYPVTTIYVTHDQQEAALMADRIIVMRDGQIEQVGSYQSLYDSPTNIFVAQFISVPTINLFEGEVSDGRWYGNLFGGIGLPMLLSEGSKVTLGIRPEHMSLEGQIEGHIRQITPFFAEKYSLLDLSSGDFSWQITVPLNQQFIVGDVIHCGFDSSSILFFDTVTQKRIS